jgi:hypothetical protein
MLLPLNVCVLKHQVGRQFLLEVGVREVPQASVVLQRFAATGTWDAAIK